MYLICFPRLLLSKNRNRMGSYESEGFYNDTYFKWVLK